MSTQGIEQYPPKAFEDDDSSSSSHVRESRSLKRALAKQEAQMGAIAQVIQGFLPTSFPSEGGLCFAASARLCADIGGDFYDVFPMKDGRVAFVMADIAGHGAASAIAMATGRALLRAAISELTPDQGPGVVIERAARWCHLQFSSEQYFTAWLGIWDPVTEMISFSCAGHPPAVLWRLGEHDPVFLVSNGCPPVGLAGTELVNVPVTQVPFEPGDRIFLYTDGWIETPSASGSFLEGPEFLEFLAQSEGAPLDQVPNLLAMNFERHAADMKIKDDISLLIVDRYV